MKVVNVVAGYRHIINVHGGGVLYHNGTYYWFGEDKGEFSNNALVGVNCYSSKDLYNWKYERVAFAVFNDPLSPVAKGCIIERPKVIFNKKDGVYWMITSGCTGWKPNAARMCSAPSIWGPWKTYPNPCGGKDAELTFYSQSTYILPVQGKKDLFIFIADRWRPENPIDGRYIWLPIQFKTDGTPVIEWKNRWTIDK